MSDHDGWAHGGDQVLQAIVQLYLSNDVAFRQQQHAPTETSVESARLRGEPLEIGGKALLIKVGQQFSLFVLPADRKIDSAKIKAYFDTKKLRFATREELAKLTGLVPGSVPPFGRPILPFDLFVDSSFQQKQRIAFNAGKLTTSHILEFENYARIAEPAFFDFSTS